MGDAVIRAPFCTHCRRNPVHRVGQRGARGNGSSVSSLLSQGPAGSNGGEYGFYKCASGGSELLCDGK